MLHVGYFELGQQLESSVGAVGILKSRKPEGARFILTVGRSPPFLKIS
jgi:hypothetical protein